MARWYSKQRKQRMNGDFLKYGFIPGRGRIALEQKPCHFASHLDLCEFTGDCDFCNHARKDDPCYASITHYGEGGSEADFYICKHCLRSKHHARYIGEEGYHQGESVNILLNFTQFFETRIEYRFQIFTAHSCDFLLPSYARLA